VHGDPAKIEYGPNVADKSDEQRGRTELQARQGNRLEGSYLAFDSKNVRLLGRTGRSTQIYYSGISALRGVGETMNLRSLICLGTALDPARNSELLKFRQFGLKLHPPAR
jgi:hypothetical protein